MNDKCIFKDLYPYNTSKEFQAVCNQSFYHTRFLLLFTPIIYLLILFIEKNFCKSSKNKYR